MKHLISYNEAAIDFLKPKSNEEIDKELSKLYEETIRGTAKEVLEHYTNKPPKGEIVIVVAGKK